MGNTRMVKRLSKIGASVLLAAAGSSFAAPTFLANYATDFVAYNYNTAAFNVAPWGYPGCGPTTGAMILNYFQNHNAATGLMEASGLDTARTLHGAGNQVGPYMQTGTDGFGSVYRIEPGLEGYGTDKGYNIDVMIHVNPGTTSPSATWDAYGPFGSSWTNDADYFAYDAGTGTWSINDLLFFNFMSAKLAAGIPIFLTVDSDGLNGGDHWVPMVGVDFAAGVGATYYYYNTWDTTLHSAAVRYTNEGGNGFQAWDISLARTVAYLGAIDGGNGTVPEPSSLALLSLGLAALAATRRRKQ